jgi:hypothetical protein
MSIGNGGFSTEICDMAAGVQGRIARSRPTRAWQADLSLERQVTRMCTRYEFVAAQTIR